MVLNHIDWLPFINRSGESTETASVVFSYIHRFHVKAPLSNVAEFHRQTASMAAITPSPIRVQVRQTPAVLAEGDEMDFTLNIGPVAIRWLARFEDVSPTGFIDRQLDGPFDRWVHQHRFERVDDATTLIIDHIHFSFRNHLWWKIVGLNMALGLPALFAYRSWKTRQLLEQ